MSRFEHHPPLVVAVLAALAASGCCYDRATTRCVQVEEPICPSKEEAAELIEADEITSEGVYYPARVYVDGDQTYEYPAECCYETQSWHCDRMEGFGRPYVRGGRTVIARPVAARGRRRAPRGGGLSPEVRARLARAWLVRGALEHAAVASFGRFALDLAALGAPEALVRDAIRAIGDEARHARAAFAVAASFGDPGHRPGALPVDPSLCADLTAFVRAVVREGCVAETVGVAILEARAAAAADPGMRRVLRGLARDEARHADLGWRALAWALAAGGGAARRAAAESMAEALADAAGEQAPAAPAPAQHAPLVRAPVARTPARQAPTGPAPSRGDAPAAPEEASFGELSPAVMESVARSAVRERVLPRAARLHLEAS